MALITDLPNELLDPILQNLLSTSPDSLVALGSTCRGLSRPVQAVLCEHVCLAWRLNSSSAMARFVAHHSGNENVRSLRLQPQRGLLHGFSLGMKTAHSQVDALCECLPTLVNLKTFSINLTGVTDRRCTFPTSVIKRILQSLPGNVVNLELDTEGIDQEVDFKRCDQPGIHLCPILNDIIPRLEFLRLRLGRMCPTMFDHILSTHSKSRLRFAEIKLELLDDRRPPSVVDCRFSRRRNLLSPNQIFEELLSLRAAGLFPYLEAFFLLSWQDKRHLRVRDVVSRTMTNFPLIGERLAVDTSGLYMTFDHHSKMYFGTLRSLEEAVMRSVDWSNALPNGTRLPVRLQPHFTLSYPLHAKNLMDQNQFLATREPHEYIAAIFDDHSPGQRAITLSHTGEERTSPGSGVGTLWV